MKNFSLIALALILSFVSCKPKSSSESNNDSTKSQLGVNPEDFKKEIDGKQVELYTLKNSKGIQVQITNFGGQIVSIITPDKDGNLADIVGGYNTIDEYVNDNMYISGIIGRFGNRICKGTFELDGETYKLAINNEPNTLHGGIKGFNKKVWDAEQKGNTLILKYVSPDMEEGYPGELSMTVTYSLTEDNEFSLVYEATTSKATVVNLTNHTHYNLKGDGHSTILDHSLQINSDAITPVDETLIPTGVLLPVENTPFDFRESKLIGKDIEDTHEQLVFGKGYDHNWVLNEEPGELAFALKLSESTTGRVMEMYTTEPGMQVYTGNFMDGTVKGKTGKTYGFRSAIALEPQHFPDSPNQENFPSTVLKPGEKYFHKSVLKFSAK